MSVKEKIVIVTFASIAIGLAMIFLFVSVGCDVFKFYAKGQTTINKSIEAGLFDCNVKAESNPEITPSCYLNIFKENNYTSEETKLYLKQNKNIDLDRVLNNATWIAAWEEFNKDSGK